MDGMAGGSAKQMQRLNLNGFSAGKRLTQDQSMIATLTKGKTVTVTAPQGKADSEYDRVMKLIKASHLTIEGSQRSKLEIWTHSYSGGQGVVRVCPVQTVGGRA